GSSAFAVSAATAVVAAAAKPAPPRNTSLPTITGTPQEGQTLTGNKGGWSGNPTSYNYFWKRCDKAGGSCSNISGVSGAVSYTLPSGDVAHTLRFPARRSSALGSSAFAVSAATAVITPAAKPPPATGCPAGSGTVQVAQLSPPARL